MCVSFLQQLPAETFNGQVQLLRQATSWLKLQKAARAFFDSQQGAPAYRTIYMHEICMIVCNCGAAVCGVFAMHVHCLMQQCAAVCGAFAFMCTV
jgi:hypothetical protein